MLCKYDRQFCLYVVLLVSYRKGAFMLEQQKEAYYHFTLSAMVDLIAEHGYCNVMNDLDEMIANEVNRKLELVDAE